jgi:hypothetical protein
MRHRQLFLSILMVSVLFTAFSLPAEAKDLKRYDKGTDSCRILGGDSMWYGKGRHLWADRCKSCHTRKNDKGAPYLNAESIPPRGWNRVFYQRYPLCAKNGAWDGITLEDQLAINDFLWRYGANTYDPYDETKCG